MSASEQLRASAAGHDAAEALARAKRKAQRRAGFLRQVLRWHWISAAICLIGMLLFAVTGITLNHALLDDTNRHLCRPQREPTRISHALTKLHTTLNTLNQLVQAAAPKNGQPTW